MAAVILIFLSASGSVSPIVTLLVTARLSLRTRPSSMMKSLPASTAASGFSVAVTPVTSLSCA